MGSTTSGKKMLKCRGKYQERGSVAFWEAKLKRMGLGMDSGHNRAVVTYGHMVRDLDWDGKVTYQPPNGERLEDGDWPISMM